MSKRCEQFRHRLTAKEPLIGTFLKTPSSIIAEVLSLSTLDVVCIDTEHAPFGRLEVDQCVAAFRAADMPTLVRIANDSSTEIRNALDCGANGILVPHVTTAEQAAAIVKSAHFGEGGRGFAGSTRASNYTKRSLSDHLAASAEQTTVIVQIEDLAALDNVSAIAAVPGIDAIFVGRIDLAVAMNCAPMDDDVVEAVQKICDSAADTDAGIGMFTPDSDEIPMWNERGCSFYLLGSEQSMILSGAKALRQLHG
jgi:2-keto-3-deoxy-L-rhamnonate aldolase RhmA